MKKKILAVMLAVLTIIILCFTLVSCAETKAVHDDPIKTYLSNDSYTLLNEFVTEHQDRTTGVATGADAAAEWIKNKVSLMDPTLTAELQKFDYANRYFDKRIEQAYNVVARKPAVVETNKTVVIGTHYDNAYGLKINGNINAVEGVYNNAGSVITLLQTISALKELSFDFNIEYVFFGAGEADMAGSSYYANNTADDVILMVNYDNVIGGEFVYYYTDEVKTEHGKLFNSVIDDNRLNIFSVPKFNHIVGGQYIEGTNLGYYHEAMYSDHVNFMVKGDMVISFSSANYSDYSSSTIKEFKGKNNIEYTAADTLLTVVERYGGGEVGIAKINDMVNSVVTAVQSTLNDKDFISVMELSKKNKFDYSVFGNIKIMSYIGYGILGAVLIIAVGLYFGLRSKAKTHPVIRMTPYGMVDLSTGEIKGVGVAPKEPIDPFADDDNFSSGSTNSDDGNKIGGETKVKDVDKTDIFDEF